MEQDPLQLVKADKWNELQNEFENDYPRGVTGYNALQTQRKWLEQGIDYGFKVFSPLGEAKNGMVAVLNEKAIYELHIECPNDDTRQLEEALKKTKHINWDRSLRVLFPPVHIVDCIKRVVKDVGREIRDINSLNFYLLDRNTPLFDVNLPQGVEFQLLSQKHIETVNSTWPHRYPGSTSYFDLLIQAKSGYGLFKDQELVSFGFVKETGALGHVYTLENHRRKGYGCMFLKMLCNVLLREGRHVNSYCIKNNVPSCKMHEKFGFRLVGEVSSVYVT